MSFHANALTKENSAAPTKPYTNTRLWPHKSPALPNAGPTTPNASNGPVIVQLIMLTVLPRSSATVFSDTTSNVMVKLTVNTLASKIPKVALRCVSRARVLIRCFINCDHGITEISSTPPESMTPASSSADCGRISFVIGNYGNTRSTVAPRATMVLFFTDFPAITACFNFPDWFPVIAPTTKPASSSRAFTVSRRLPTT